MIRIRISLNTLEMQVNGHARSAAKGEDLVCCAISTLTQTLVRNMELAYKRGELQDLMEEIDEGHIYLMPIPYGWSLQSIVTAYRVILEGIKGVMEGNEKYIKLEEE